jgi:hypothetical protein
MNKFEYFVVTTVAIACENTGEYVEATYPEVKYRTTRLRSSSFFILFYRLCRQMSSRRIPYRKNTNEHENCSMNSPGKWKTSWNTQKSITSLPNMNRLALKVQKEWCKQEENFDKEPIVAEKCGRPAGKMVS